MKNKRHQFKWLTYKKEKVRIDRDIAYLIYDMWRLGIDTTNCCQGQCSENCKHKLTHTKLKDGSVLSEKIRTPNCQDRVWIAFASARDLERFLNIVAVYEKDDNDSMYALINGWSSRDEWKRGKFRCILNPDNWEYIHRIPNEGVREHVEKLPNNIPGEPKYYWIRVDDDCPKNNFRMQPQLQFPRKHISYVEERLKLALKAKNK